MGDRACERPQRIGWTRVSLLSSSTRSPLASAAPAFTAHTVTSAGVLGAASTWRSRLAPVPPETAGSLPANKTPRDTLSAYRSWAELLRRTFGEDALECPRCQGRMRLIAVVTEAASAARYLAAIGEPTELPRRAPHRGPPYWASTVLRRQGGAGATTTPLTIRPDPTRLRSRRLRSADASSVDVPRLRGAPSLAAPGRWRWPTSGRAVIAALRAGGVGCAPAGEPLPHTHLAGAPHAFQNAAAFRTDALRLPFLGRIGARELLLLRRRLHDVLT